MSKVLYTYTDPKNVERWGPTPRAENSAWPGCDTVRKALEVLRSSPHTQGYAILARGDVKYTLEVEKREVIQHRPSPFVKWTEGIGVPVGDLRTYLLSLPLGTVVSVNGTEYLRTEVEV